MNAALVSVSLPRCLLGLCTHSPLQVWQPGLKVSADVAQLCGLGTNCCERSCVRNSCEKPCWGLFPFCLSAVFKLRPLLVVAACPLLQLCLFLAMYSAEPDTDSCINCLAWL